MPRALLTGGSYEAKSIIANANRCINLYPELMPQSEQGPVPVTHYYRPGLGSLSSCPTPANGRCLYQASNGNLYAVVGMGVYSISSTWVWTRIGSIPAQITPCSITDNGISAFLTDGSQNGYTWDLATNTFSQSMDPGCFGGNHIDYMDSFIMLTRPGTAVFYCTLSNSVTFNGLYLASKTGAPDPCMGVVALNRNIWLIGQQTTELWYDAGNALFPFSEMPGMMVEHGCIAPWSIAKEDTSVFWLSQDKQGQGVVMRGAGYVARRCSNHALETAIQGYVSAGLPISDAIGYTFQVLGHTFYMLSFPSADATWAYDGATNEWTEWLWTDAQGSFHRWRVAFGAFAYGQNVGIDWQTGALYQVSPDIFTDAGQPIVRLRRFPHMLSDGNRVFYRRFIADMEVGNYANTLTDQIAQPLLDSNGQPLTDSNGFILYSSGDNPGVILGSPYDAPIYLSWSDNRGVTFGNPIVKSLGLQGKYKTSLSYQRLGMARDRVFQLQWCAPVKTALNGAWVDYGKTMNG